MNKILVGHQEKLNSGTKFSFIASQDFNNVNLFPTYYDGEKISLPPSSDFVVYINDIETNQSYDNISFKANDKVVIELKNENSYFPYFSLYWWDDKENYVYDCIKEILDPLPLLKVENKGVLKFESFYRSHSLQVIPENLFINNKQITHFHSTFGMTSLQSIPEKLFYNNSEAISFYNCFGRCPIQSIPENLFSKNIKATNFSSCFSRCPIQSISEKLFYNNLETTMVVECFSDTSITFIPENLFINNTKIATFDRCFYECTIKNTILKITTIRSTCDNFCSPNSDFTIQVPVDSRTYENFNSFKNSYAPNIKIVTY